MRGKGRLLNFGWIAVILLVIALVNMGCDPNSGNETVGMKQSQVLASWNETETRSQLVDFVTSVSDPKGSDYIPQKDRIAVFDMDGTIVCEQPLWLEMRVAVEEMYQTVLKNPQLLEEDPLYRIAYLYHEDPNDPTKRVALEEKAVPIMTHAFEGIAQEEYVAKVTALMQTTLDENYQILLKDTFYQPMLELITYLQAYDFQVYIVSGSEEGLIWGACAGQVPLSRDHEIGTRIALDYTYDPSQPEFQFVRGDQYLQPRNLAEGKSENIYYQLGKTPVFAFGNTADDFEMFKLALSSKYKSVAFVLDHDDAEREVNYPASSVKASWKKAADTFGWQIVSMKANFKQVFVTE